MFDVRANPLDALAKKCLKASCEETYQISTYLNSTDARLQLLGMVETFSGPP